MDEINKVIEVVIGPLSERTTLKLVNFLSQLQQFRDYGRVKVKSILDYTSLSSLKERERKG